MLKLEAPAIVETIMFGKYIKPHVSDLKKFQIFGGTDENNLSLLLTAWVVLCFLFNWRHKYSYMVEQAKPRCSVDLKLGPQQRKLVTFVFWNTISFYVILKIKASIKRNSFQIYVVAVHWIKLLL